LALLFAFLTAFFFAVFFFLATASSSINRAEASSVSLASRLPKPPSQLTNQKPEPQLRCGS
jgi:hypothetical protein